MNKLLPHSEEQGLPNPGSLVFACFLKSRGLDGFAFVYILAESFFARARPWNSAFQLDRLSLDWRLPSHVSFAIF